MPERPPNVLMFFTDQQRFDTIGTLGNSVMRTPNFDRLVRAGTSFTSAYSPSPVCVPARCSFHYGRYPSGPAAKDDAKRVESRGSGCYENNYRMPENLPSFMSILTEAGYRTHGVGKCHFTPDGLALRGFQTRETQEEIVKRPETDDYLKYLHDQGFTHMSDPHGVRGEMYYIPQPAQMPARLHPTQWVGDRSVAFIENQASKGEPWMLFSSFIHPHPPFAPPSPWHKLYRAPLMPLPMLQPGAESLNVHINRLQNRYKYRDQGLDMNLLRNIKAHYYACISFIDMQIGRVIDVLEKTGALDRTLIIFTSDHGEHLGDRGCFGKRSMHDSCARVPMIARLPGRFAENARCDRPASLVDVFPTVLSAAGVDAAPARPEGIDLAELAAGCSKREHVFSQIMQGDSAIYTSVGARWKYAYSAPDDAEFLLDRRADTLETRNRAGMDFLRDELATERAALVEFLKGAGETRALDGEGWKRYPKASIPQDPDSLLLIQDHPWADLSIPGYTDAV